MNIKEQLEYLKAGGIEILPTEKDLEERLKEGKPLRIKLGIDPTAPDLHLGHTVCLQLLRRFQNLGHHVILLIGGFTACLGDPTGRNETRPPLSKEDVAKNAKTYIDQVSKILDMDKVEIVNNQDWLNKLDLNDIIKLLSLTTVNQLIAKDAFGTRIDNGFPLYLHEILYPILQGYDSVAIKADIELGGQDQRFNVLAARDLQKAHNQKPQLAMLAPLLVGMDGSKKMSKSYDNYIGIAEDPKEMFGKTMSLPDELLADWYSLVLALSPEELSAVKSQIESREINPRDLKIRLAKEIITMYHSAADAEMAEADFVQRFTKKELPDDIPLFGDISDDMTLAQVLHKAGLVESGGEAKRKLKEGAVKLNGDKASIEFKAADLSDGDILQIGKRKFVKIQK